jgi:hypothetical protein
MNSNFPIYIWNDRETTNALLERDWFIDNEGIVELLELADQDAWEYVCENRMKYSKRIRDMIDSYFKPAYKTKVTVSDLTDEELELIERIRSKKYDDAFRKDWEEELKTLPPRSPTDIDTLSDNTWEILMNAKKDLLDYFKVSQKKYVAPKSRTTVSMDPKQKKLEDRVRDLENEYNLLKKAIETLDSIYLSNKEDEYRETWMPKMQT